jgi:Fe2+ transport system protein FeoA
VNATGAGATPAVTLAELHAGERAVVTGFVADDEHLLRKLLAIGLAPGDRLTLRRRWPVFVFDAGATSFAIDGELARRVTVQREPA